MGQMLLSVLLILTACATAQVPHSTAEQIAIHRAKTLDVFSLDRSLPKVTLDFFLNYEAGGSKVGWEFIECGESSTATKECVRASFEVNHRMATVVVAVGRSRAGLPASPTVLAVTISEIDGTIRPLRHLGDLPQALHRPAPRMPRDLPVPHEHACFGKTGMPRTKRVRVGA